MLTLGGIILIGIGLYFIFLRPALLPEDLHFVGRSFSNIQENLPELLKWLSYVFLVMGGYIFSAGFLTCYLALTGFRSKQHGAALVALVVGLSSIGLMVVVNFLIGSDFKWVLFLCFVPWIIALLLYKIESNEY